MRLFLVLLFCCLGFPAAADEPDPALPALYAVQGVASDDVLNIRALPHGAADIIGALAADADGIEVVALSRAGEWAKINVQERSGWVAMRFLRREVAERSTLGLPESLQCFGTEPFWSMAFYDEPALILRTPDSETGHAILSTSPAPDSLELAQDGFRFTWQAAGAPVTAYIRPGICTDGMSDRTYGLHYFDDRGPRVGCCSLN